MVGRRTSRGCATCRQRRIKCDLDRPACQKCIQAGWKCPGYDARFIHNDANGTVPKNGLLSMPLSSSELLRLDYAHKMEAGVLSATLDMMPPGHVLMHLPVCIGRSPALDDAVRCITQNTTPSGQLHCLPYDTAYVNALGSLQKALRDPCEIHAAETLAAALVLQMYEANKDYSAQKWIYHARGVVRMLQTRNITDTSSALEKAVLGLEVGSVFLSGLISQPHSFLSRDAWSQMPRRAHLDSKPDSDLFNRVIVEGPRAPDMDVFYSELLGSCAFIKDAGSHQRYRVMDVATKEMLLMRQNLLSRMFAFLEPACSEQKANTLSIATHIATEFFLIITDSFILIMQEQVRALASKLRAFSVLDDLTEQTVRSERAQTLRSILPRFQHLTLIDAELSCSLSAALITMLSTMIPPADRNLYGHKEAATLLDIVDHELSEADWRSLTRRNTPDRLEV